MKRLKRLLPPIPTKVMYLWEKAQHRIRRIELFTQEDVEKKSEIPEAGSQVQRLKEATDRAGVRRNSIISRWRRKL